jgi:hypothetical protein
MLGRFFFSKMQENCVSLYNKKIGTRASYNSYNYNLVTFVPVTNKGRPKTDTQKQT